MASLNQAILSSVSIPFAPLLEQTDLAALRIRSQEVNDFDTGLEGRGNGEQLFKGRRRVMDAVSFSFFMPVEIR